MKVSEIDESIIRDYLKIDEDESSGLLNIMLDAAIAQVKTWTALEDLDQYEDITIAVLVLIGQMYDKRTYTDKDNQENPVVSMILNAHRRNLVKGETCNQEN